MSNKKESPGNNYRAVYMWRRGTESNCRHGDFQTRFFKIQKCCDHNQLILFKFLTVFWVLFGDVWKYLTLTGTIWAQFCFLEIHSVNRRHHRRGYLGRHP